jgi:hypothetical protein
MIVGSSKDTHNISPHFWEVEIGVEISIECFEDRKKIWSKRLSFLRKQESRVPGENRDPVFGIVPCSLFSQGQLLT